MAAGEAEPIKNNWGAIAIVDDLAHQGREREILKLDESCISNPEIPKIQTGQLSV